MNLKQLCDHLQNRRRMYLPNDRYSTAVSFIEGFNVALDGKPLKGFQRWLAERIRGGESNLHWAYLVASVRMPEVLEGGLSLDQVPSDLEEQLIDDLLRLIGEFLALPS
ncbi:hypothetical protein HZZ00_18995 [Streptomyces sp. NEAU-sy36]|uniref:hypothetical protein n=1 Tax=unclassified Streptomyces TaxID=2593676 RepID=UPI0015D57CE6|nr:MULTISPECIES: hypothetical protein [unclassified Streptomyces]QLJ02890.1 hypothetical protein HZZ00_18995 [Streptomyces sp. NEAU-sy36]